MSRLDYNARRSHGTGETLEPHFLPLVTKCRSAWENSVVLWPFEAQASPAGCKQRISQHLPASLLSVTSLFLYTCCSLQACSHFFCSFIHVRFYSYFLCSSFNISSTNFCSECKSSFAYSYLEAVAYLPSIFSRSSAAFPPSLGTQALDVQIFYLCLHGEICQTLLLDKKRRGGQYEFHSAPGVGAKKWQVLIFVSMTAISVTFSSVCEYIFSQSLSKHELGGGYVVQLVLCVGSWKESQTSPSALGRWDSWAQVTDGTCADPCKGVLVTYKTKVFILNQPYIWGSMCGTHFCTYSTQVWRMLKCVNQLEKRLCKNN